MRVLAPNFFWKAFTPVFRTADALASQSHTLFSSFRNARALTAENEQLANENVAFATENQTLLRKVADLEALFTPSSPEVSSGILAGVVARPPESPYDTLVLAAGTNAGVTTGMEAFGAGGVPLGIVSSVLADFSRVTLLSSPNVTFVGWVGSSGLPLTITGAGAGAMNATIARSASVTVGDTVFAPGPGMLMIGKIVRVDSDPSVPGVTLRIQPVSNPFSVAWVVLRNTGTLFSITATSTP